MQLRKRYPSLYIPSDFTDVSIEWPKTTPIENPISISTAPITYHILHKDIDCPNENLQALNPPDADFRFSVKVKFSFSLFSNVIAQLISLRRLSFTILSPSRTSVFLFPLSCLLHYRDFYILLAQKDNAIILYLRFFRLS